jgi:cholesterol transport system auxiliary component
MERKVSGLWLALVIVITAVSLLPGCFGRSKPPYLVEEYVFQYSPPSPGGNPSLKESLRIERFAVAREYNTRSMLFQPDEYRLSAYTYHRWKANPGDMAADYLFRDFRESGLFQAVFSYHSGQRTRFVLEGGVTRIHAATPKSGSLAILSLYVTLLDLLAPELSGKVCLQKAYTAEEPMTDEGPEALARAASKAMARLSREILEDVYRVAASRM